MLTWQEWTEKNSPPEYELLIFAEQKSPRDGGLLWIIGTGYYQGAGKVHGDPCLSADLGPSRWGESYWARIENLPQEHGVAYRGEQ